MLFLQPLVCWPRQPASQCSTVLAAATACSAHAGLCCWATRAVLLDSRAAMHAAACKIVVPHVGSSTLLPGPGLAWAPHALWHGPAL